MGRLPIEMRVDVMDESNENQNEGSNEAEVDKKCIKWQLEQAATLDATELINNITTSLARGGICFNLPADEFNRKIDTRKNRTTLK